MGRGEKLVLCRWGCEMVRSLCKTARQFPPKKEHDVPMRSSRFAPRCAPEETEVGSQGHVCTPMRTAAAHTTAKRREQPRVQRWAKS